ENVQGLPANTWCYHIEASTFGSGIAYAVFDGHTKNDMNTYVYKTSDFGKSWKPIMTDQINGFARAFQEDYENENLLFLGTELGLYVTVDGGLNWSKFTNNMPSVAIHQLELQKATSDLVMGTHGRGVIILDDISPLRQITADMLNEKLVFLDTKPTEMWEEDSFGGTSGETQFVGNNPSRSARIVYYLSKRHTFGKMTMKVLDSEGNFVTNLAPGKKKGINVVSWGCTMRSPKVAQGKTFAQGGMAAPRVKAGKYTIVIQKGKEMYEHEIEVKYPSKTEFTIAERDQQFDTAMDLYKLTEDLAYMVYEIDEMINYIESNNDQRGLSNQAAITIAKLQALKETLVITTGDNYVGAAEPELREKLAKIYAKIVGYYGAPTNSQMKNVALLKGDYEAAVKTLEAIKAKSWKKYMKMATKLELSPLELKAYEEFVKKS
ncbi:MAG: hypothetical protein AAF193_03475, partial [Bacteroidota bacterium]